MSLSMSNLLSSSPLSGKQQNNKRHLTAYMAVLIIVALFCLVIFTATTVNSEEIKTTTTAATKDVKIVEEEILESQLLKEKPVGSPESGPSATIPVLGEDEDDDFEDYDTDDFAVLGNEWLLKEIKEIEEQIQTVSSDDEDVGDVANPQGSSNGSKSA